MARSQALLLALVLVLGCAHERRQGPLVMPLGAPRASVETRLRELSYCPEPRPLSRRVSVPRCDSPGAKLGRAWVIVEYDRSDRLVRAQRLERFVSEDAALARFNELARERSEQLGEPSREARSAVAAAGRVPDGAQTWIAWSLDDGDATATVYLVRPEPGVPPVVIDELAPTR